MSPPVLFQLRRSCARTLCCAPAAGIVVLLLTRGLESIPQIGSSTVDSEHEQSAHAREVVDSIQSDSVLLQS